MIRRGGGDNSTGHLYVSLWENEPASHLINYLSKPFPNEFMVLIASFKSSSTQRDVHLVNYGPI